MLSVKALLDDIYKNVFLYNDKYETNYKVKEIENIFDDKNHVSKNFNEESKKLGSKITYKVIKISIFL